MLFFLVLVHLALCAFAADHLHQSSSHSTHGAYPSDVRGRDGALLIPGHIYVRQEAQGDPSGSYVVYIGPVEDSRKMIFVLPLNPNVPETDKLKVAECFNNAESLPNKDETISRDYAHATETSLLHLPPEPFRHATLKGNILADMHRRAAIAFEEGCRTGQLPKAEEMLMKDRVERSQAGHAAKAA